MQRLRPRIHAFARATALLLGALMAPKIVGAAQASASITDLSFTLIDLAPEDGLAPELLLTQRFDWVTGTSGSGYVTHTDAAGNQTRDEDRFSHPFSSTNFLTPGSAQASLEGVQADAQAVNNAFQALAQATLPSGSSDLLRTATASVSAIALYQPAGFLLSPNTTLLIQGRYSVHASIDPEGHDQDRALAVITLDASMASIDGSPRQQGLLSHVAQAGRSAGMSLESASSGEFTFTFINQTRTALAGSFGNRDAYVDVSVNAPVPEPGTWAFMLTGFAALAGVADRRRTVKLTR